MWVTYRDLVTAGWTTLRWAARSPASRTNDAADHVSGEAEPAAPPLVKPIDAIVGSVPNGDGATAVVSQSCSGMSPTPDENAAIVLSSAAAPEAFPVARLCSPRSADSAGQTCPVPLPLGAHGWPSAAASP